MFSPRRTALYIAIGAMAFAAGEASAGCKVIPTPNGSYVCASWIKGTTDCVVTSEDGLKLVSGECIITGVEALSYTEESDLYCATGAPPEPECVIPEEEGFSALSSSTSQSAAKATKKAKKPKKDKDCKPKHGGKHNGKHVGHDDDCSQRPGEQFLSAKLSAPVCIPDGFNGFNCTSSGSISLQDGGACTSGVDQGTFGTSAAEYLGITFACVEDGYGGKVCNYDDPIYDYCKLNVDGNYDCVDISDQYPSPEDPYCADAPG